MADEFTGTNTDKIDKLIAAVVELKTTVRVCAWMIGLSLPFLVGLLGFLVSKMYETSSKVDQVLYRLERMERAAEKNNSKL